MLDHPGCAGSYNATVTKSCPDPANSGIDTGVCSDNADAVGADYDGFHNGVAMSYDSAVLAVAESRNVSWTLWAWVPGADGSENLGSCGGSG